MFDPPDDRFGLVHLPVADVGEGERLRPLGEVDGALAGVDDDDLPAVEESVGDDDLRGGAFAGTGLAHDRHVIRVLEVP